IRMDVLYPALGGDVRSQLARSLGAECNELGYVKTDDHQRTCVAGLYAAGDVVNELNQICVATGHAAIAATDIYNKLREEERRRLGAGNGRFLQGVAIPLHIGCARRLFVL